MSPRIAKLSCGHCALVLQIESWGYRAMPVSAASGKGLEQLNTVLKDRVSVVAGPSGIPPGQLLLKVHMISCT